MLGWLNATVKLSAAASFEPGKYVRNLALKLREAFKPLKGEIGHLKFERSVLGAPSSYGPVDGFTQVPGAPAGTLPVLVFSPAGLPEATGALRFADDSGRNHLETAVTSRAGKVEIRKFLPADDSPTSSPGFFQEGTDSHGASVWVWY